ncbi:MAG: HAMP domain-containing histidine kinase [Blautia sp.]|nr:HAMP domain-containing histidine kinase [Lachnoclostridium sp.]MCM1211869.1 HAMP domain-containing histidine kinase [Blautia sp.]
MKLFSRYFSKYLLSFIGLILVLILLDAAAFAFTFYNAVSRNLGAAAPQNMLKKIADASSIDAIPEEAAQLLGANSLWAMYLNAEGTCNWSVNLPEEIPTEYTIGEVAIFSKGYLKDYPVFVQSEENGLLVIGYPKGSYAKITGNYYPADVLRRLPLFFLGILVSDLLILFLAYSYSKAKISKNTEPIISSMEALAKGKSIELTLSGELAEIAESINKASHILSRQNASRANWISGVSHDIRTPLSMIMGYAERIAHNQNADSRIKEQAVIISRQSGKIKELVQDLNLVSKLEYEMQPLQKETIRLAKLLRSYATDLINSGLPDGYTLEVEIAPAAENCVIECDARLLTRAVNNLVQNSIHANPGGCTIVLVLQITDGKLHIIIRDNGIGIPAERLKDLKNRPHYMESTDERLDLRHGLGLLLVRQIVEAHHGTMEIGSKEGEGFWTDMGFSCSDKR